jgi:hypothetical protein
MEDKVKGHTLLSLTRLNESKHKIWLSMDWPMKYLPEGCGARVGMEWLLGSPMCWITTGMPYSHTNSCGHGEERKESDNNHDTRYNAVMHKRIHTFLSSDVDTNLRLLSMNRICT